MKEADIEEVENRLISIDYNLREVVEILRYFKWLIIIFGVSFIGVLVFQLLKMIWNWFLGY